MAIVSVELFSGLRENSQQHERMVGIRRFNVRATAGETLTADFVLNSANPVTPPLPAYNEEFIFQGYVLSCYGNSVSQTVAPNTLEVEFYYDNFIDTRVEEMSESVTPEVIPVYLRETYVGDYTITGSGAIPTLKEHWVESTMEFASSRAILKLTVASTKWGTVERTKVRNEVGKIHRIDGAFWMYTGAMASNAGSFLTGLVDNQRWMVTHSWVGDPGYDFRQLDLGAGTSFTILPSISPNCTSGCGFRGPFEQYLRIPASDPLAVPPTPGSTPHPSRPSITIIPATVRPAGGSGQPNATDGWTNLPQMPDNSPLFPPP